MPHGQELHRIFLLNSVVPTALYSEPALFYPGLSVRGYFHVVPSGREKVEWTRNFYY